MISVHYKTSILFIILSILISIPQNAISESEWKVYELSLEGQEYKIPYKITNGDVVDIMVDASFTEMIVQITGVIDEGTIEITIPRQLVVSKTNGDDEEFLVVVDGEDSRYEEIGNTPCFRSILIELPAGTEEILVIGGITEATIIKVLPIYIATDKPAYELGENIKVSGCTNLGLDDKEVVLEVINPEAKLYKNMTVTPETDGSFSTSVVIEGEDAVEGSYTAKATYAGESAMSTFVVPEFPVSVLIASLAIGLMVGIMRLRNVKLLVRSSQNCNAI